MDKIQEIRTALAEATPDWVDNGNEIVSKQNLRLGIGGFLKDEDNHLAANAPEYITYLLQLLDGVDQSKINILAARDNERNLKEQARRIIDGLRKQIEIKDKALEFYADKENYEERFIEDTNVPIAGGYFSTPKVVKERGERARAALKGEDTNE
ncbi:hypothetical protein P4H71_04230 [Paenibacillus kribbensis]|uniref:hypothetical protein n=1 Tax=Paenibacillus kribbensis TaxID=172713 RepID=UPI002DBE073C|nr:hypothetical protein [Paenibacillus kribbensis]MEC0233562.1 hypothetical protein [Paenibacillus kribbensis]